MLWIHKRGEMNTRSLLKTKTLYDESLLKYFIHAESRMSGIPHSYNECGFWISRITWTSSDIFSMSGGPRVATED